ncbi:MAG: hypothetical protein M3P84_00775 [Chloroflexota bacterium]|nr:hypothetical protein [Chloroflexota bacterium]
MGIDLNDGPEPGAADPASLAPDPAPPTFEPEPTIAAGRWAGRPLSVSAIAGIILVGGGAIEGYAIALTGDPVGSQYSMLWALLGAGLVLTAWALRGRRWWGAAAAIAVSVVGLFAGMYGVYGVLVLSGAGTDDRASWGMTVGLIAVGAASIAIIGLLSSAWIWLTSSASSRSAPVGSQPA